MPPVRSLLLALLVAAACGADLDFVRVQRLAVAGGPGGGQTVVSAGPALHMTVRIASDATDFNPVDIMRFLVNGVDRTADMTIGGDYAVLTVDPPPVGVQQVVELYTRTGTMPLDTAAYEAMPFTGPTLQAVMPDSAAAGAQVMIFGTGLDAAPARVFFGGVEGAVDAATATTITATVPDAAEPGLVLVLVGADSAVGLVAFQPLDALGQPVPRSTRTRLHYAAPARGGIETVVTVGGFNFTEDALPRFNLRYSSRVFNVLTLDLAPVGEVTTAFAVVLPFTDPGAGTLQLRENGDSNTIPFTVE
jgi:hypothetical protein